jgi:hypothetical protein
MRQTTHPSKRRQRRSADEIRALLSSYRSSGLTQREFADQNRLSFSTFTYWLRRYRDTESATEGNGLIRVMLTEGPAHPGGVDPHLELVTPSGWTLRIPAEFPAEATERLLAILTSRC